MSNDLGGGGGRRRRTSGGYKGPWKGKGPYLPGGSARDKHPMLYGGDNGVTDQQAGKSNYFSALRAQQAAMQQAAGYGDEYGYGSSGGGYGGGGYGGGGYGGGGGRDTSKIQGMLTSERDNARKALPGYLNTYNQGISKIGRESAGMTRGYSAEINKLMQHLIAQGGGEAGMLTGDVAAQGGDIAGMQAAAGENRFGTQAIGGAQNAYNLRLAQLMGAATADRKATGQAVNQAAYANLDDSYMRALIALQG